MPLATQITNPTPTHDNTEAHLLSAQRQHSRLITVLPWVFLATGLVFRWIFVDYARFTGDEALFYRMAQQIVTDGALPVLGPSVSGTDAKHPGATFYYLMALPNLISSHPRWSGMFISLLSILSLGFLVRMVNQLRGPRTAALTACLVAVSPWYVLYSDRIWNSNVAPWLALMTIYGIHRMQCVPRSRWAFGVALLLVLLFQFHLSTPILWVVTICVLWASRPRIHWSALLFGAFVGALFYGPYLIYEIQTDFSNVRAILSDAGGTEQGWLPPLQSWLYVVLFGTSDVGYHVHTGYWRPYDPFWQLGSAAGLDDARAFYGMPLVIAVWCSVVLCVGSWIWRLATTRANLGRLRQLFACPVWGTLLIGAVAGALLLAVSHKAAYPHYVNLLLGVGMVPLAEVLNAIAGTRSRPRTALAVGLVVVLSVSMATSTWMYYSRIDSKVGLRTHLEVADIITTEQDTETFSLRFPYFNTRFPLSVLAEYTLFRPWLYQNTSKTVYEIRPKRSQTDVPPDKVDALWEIGPIWLIRNMPR